MAGMDAGGGRQAFRQGVKPGTLIGGGFLEGESAPGRVDARNNKPGLWVAGKVAGTVKVCLNGSIRVSNC
jgi:hypothetical protein